MADRPILFSAPMILALIAGRKTQTRRILKNQDVWDRAGEKLLRQFPHQKSGTPYSVGDRLWVREAWRTFVSLDDVPPRDIWSHDKDRGAGIAYEAGGGMSITKSAERERNYSDERDDLARFGRLRPGMFMPRWASRFVDTVTDVRVQRLQNIIQDDAIVEGIEFRPDSGWGIWNPDGTMRCGGSPMPIDAYRCLWINLHGNGSWEANPWIAAYTFTVARHNIDEPAP